MKRILAALVLCIAGPSALWAGEKTGASAADFFEARVRPIFAEHCFSCHGAKKQMGGVRLDSRKGVLAESDHGPIVVPGVPEKSVLLHVVKQAGEIKMPPKGKLPPQAIETLTTWIKLGAPWPDKKEVAADPSAAAKNHWAFRPVQKPGVPIVKDPTWPATTIDSFILSKLEAKNLRPSTAADRRVLIRRATFDLIGLPPTVEEVEQFVKCENPQAGFEAVIDRLLASPHYGERWGRHWLDVARYADTKGYVFFEEANFPWAYTYRDYVIRAFNGDVPYDRFILEQLAADQLDLKADKRALTALGFLTLGGRFMNNQHDIIDDRIDVVTRGLMGLTVTCARCHDHKFDPIPSKDYYALYGVFASSAEATIPPLFEPPPKTEEYANFEKELNTLEQKLTDFVKMKHAELATNARKRVAEYMLAAHALRDQPNTEEFMLLADGNDLNPTMIVRWQSYLNRMAKTHDPVFAPWVALSALPEKDFAAQTKRVLSELSRPDVNPILVKALTADPPTSIGNVAQRYAAVLRDIDQKKAVFGRAEEELHAVFYGPDAPANVAMLPYGDLSLLPDRPSQGKLQELRKALEKHRSSGKGAPARAHALEDLPTPYEPYVFVRGNPNNKGESVGRGLPALLAGRKAASREGSGRLELARAIASRENPLTARVLVNRVWLHHFGNGLVRTPSDFGLRSDPPSHPELLDHLATTFMDDGWSLKKLHKRIMLSRVYQQKSDDRPECASVDPENRLLWKFARQRLDFETTRDALLAVTGRLNRTVGGPSVSDLLGTHANRRTLYTHLDRLNVPGIYRTFDFPSPDATSPQREETTIAPQALFLMNHPFVMNCAKAVLQRNEMLTEKDASKKIERLYRLLYGRAPAPEEVRWGGGYVETEGDTLASWERYVHSLVQANEFVWLD